LVKNALSIILWFFFETVILCLSMFTLEKSDEAFWKNQDCDVCLLGTASSLVAKIFATCPYDMRRSCEANYQCMHQIYGLGNNEYACVRFGDSENPVHNVGINL
jgi:hypothetical protein